MPPGYSAVPTAKSNTYGPIEISTKSGGRATEFLTIPFVQVDQSNVIVRVLDNAAKAIDLGVVADSAYARITYEIVIVGIVKGFEDTLMRVQTNGTYAPVGMTFWAEDGPYSDISFRARVFIGGKPAKPDDLNFDQDFRAQATVYVQNRAGQ